MAFPSTNTKGVFKKEVPFQSTHTHRHIPGLGATEFYERRRLGIKCQQVATWLIEIAEKEAQGAAFRRAFNTSAWTLTISKFPNQLGIEESRG